ncbi:epithelial-stromal interaction protein 1 isoform X2 [Lithobates pipiens]
MDKTQDTEQVQADKVLSLDLRVGIPIEGISALEEWKISRISNRTQTNSSSILLHRNQPHSNGSYVVIPPNQAKRNKLLTMANKEEEEYNHFVESRRSGSIKLTPKKLGGDTPETKAREQQQITQLQSKYQKQFKRDEYKRRQREEEEAEIQKKKDIQRKKAEKLEEKRRLEEIERKERWHAHRTMKNSEFLDRLSQPANSSSYSSYERTPSAWERRPSGEEQDWNNYIDQEEERMLQLALKESMKTAKSASAEEEHNRAPCSPGMKEYTASQQLYNQLREEEERKRQQMEEEHYRKASQQLYKQLREEEERKRQQMEEEHCRKKIEEERRRQQVEKTEPYQASKQFYRSYKQQIKEEEERKLQEMKEEQQRKSELLEVKKAEEEKERTLSQQEERRRVNNAFLDKLQRLSTKKEEYSGESNTWA